MKALIFCAGAGTRMRPITLETPKPLVEAAGIPMAVRQILALKAAGITEFVVNAAHLSDVLVSRLGDGSDLGVSIKYSIEGASSSDALETRGGIVKALPLLTDGTEPFIAVAGDIVTDYPYELLVGKAEGLGCNALAHLVLVDNPDYHPLGDMCLGADGRITRSRGDRLTFSSLGAYSPKMFEGLDEQKAALFPWMNQFIDAGLVTGERYDGMWFNVGDAEELARAEAELLR